MVSIVPTEKNREKTTDPGQARVIAACFVTKTDACPDIAIYRGRGVNFLTAILSIIHLGKTLNCYNTSELRSHGNGVVTLVTGTVLSEKCRKYSWYSKQTDLTMYFLVLLTRKTLAQFVIDPNLFIAGWEQTKSLLNGNNGKPNIQSLGGWHRVEQTRVTGAQYIISLSVSNTFVGVSVQIFYDSARCCPSAGRCHNWDSYRNKICQHCHCQHIFEWILWKLTKFQHPDNPISWLSWNILAVSNFGGG